MSTLAPASWWTNKRLFWFVFWAFLFGFALLFEEQRIYNTKAMYRVQTYRVYRGGGQYPVGDPRIASGDELAQNEISRVAAFRVLGVLGLVAGVAGTIVIFGRLGRGESVFREAFRKR